MSDLKPEVQKTIKRLASQKNHEVLKNKIRSWIVTREINITDFIRCCREKSVNVPAVVLNKIGMLFSTGKEGLHEDSDNAFIFYLAAGDLGFPSANGNVAQYYYDGRAPGGKNLELAYQYCRKAIELGADKFMLMSEILHERQDYPETIRYLRKIIESKSAAIDFKKRLEARKLEIQCLYQSLQRVFQKLNGASFPSPSAMIGNNSPLKLRSSYGNNSGSIDWANNGIPYIPSPLTIKTSMTSLNHSSPSPNLVNNSNSGRYALMSPKGSSTPNGYHHNMTPSAPTPNAYYDQQLFQHHLPGWFYITDELEGFDMNACGELTARAEVITMEAEAIKSAYDTAEAHLAYAKKHKFSEEIINALMNNKVQEYQRIYESLEINKSLLLNSWNQYVDVEDHILRRQSYTEKRFFNPQRITNALIFGLAKELYHRRLYDYLDDYLDADWNSYYRPNEYLNEPLVLTTLSSTPYRIPSFRSIIVAERSLIETAMGTYGRNNGYHHCQKTGWTGTCNNLIQHLAKEIRDNKAAEALESATGGKKSANSTNDHHDDDQQGDVDQHGDKATVVPLNHTKNPNQSKELLLKEYTYQETIVIGSATIRYKHHTHPVLFDQVVHAKSHSHQHNTATTSSSSPVKKSSKASSIVSQEIVASSPAAKHGHNAAHPDHEVILRGLYYYQMDDLGDSDDIMHFLNRITMIEEDDHFVENEKKLADLIVKFTREGKPILLQELQLINEDVNETECNYLMRILYHYFVKRLVPFILSPSTSPSATPVPPAMETHVHDLPLASGQSRAIVLMKLGFLSVKELFAYDSPYGIFFFRSEEHVQSIPRDPHHLDNEGQFGNNKDLATLDQYKKLRLQLSNINALYQKSIMETKPQNFSSCIQFWKSHRHGNTIPTYTVLKRELQDMYGGEHDSDDEDDHQQDNYGSDDRELEKLVGKLKI